MARKWSDLHAEIGRSGVTVTDLARYFGVSRSRLSTHINPGDLPDLSDSGWARWMDAIKACSQGTPIR